jgi:hypothetical protein
MQNPQKEKRKNLKKPLNQRTFLIFYWLRGSVIFIEKIEEIF